MRRGNDTLCGRPLEGALLPIGLAIPLALLLALVPACKGGERHATPDASALAGARPKPSIRFAKAEGRSLPQTLDISGTLAADETSEVAAQASGVVVRLATDVGDRVKKGDPIVILDPRNAELQSATASAAVSEARAKLALQQGAPPGKLDPDSVPEVRAAKQTRDLAKADADRIQQLLQQGATSQSSWDEARTRAENEAARYDAAVNGVRATLAALSSAQAQARLASKSLADTTVRAPFDGAIAERRISVGEFAHLGQVIAVVVSDNPLRLQIDVPETNLAQVEIGKPVAVAVAAYPGRQFPGVIKRISASLKPASRALPIEAEIDNSKRQLRPGLFAQGQLVLGGDPRPAVFVLETAVGDSGTSARVFVKAGDRVTERLVKLGRKADGVVEVIGPVAPGDEVAIDKVNELADGLEITVVSDGSPR